MRRVTRKIVVFILGVWFIVFYCNFIIYYVVIAQCRWLPLPDSNGPVLKALIMSDTHLLGPYKGNVLDKILRDWQMHKAFRAIIDLHYPDVVFVLGDLFDEGDFANDEEFKEYFERFHKIFALPEDIQMYVVAGNHDIGFHSVMRYGNRLERFKEIFSAPLTQFVTIKGSHFVLINSMAMEGDSCSLCKEARREIDEISDVLKCSESPDQCIDAPKLNYSRPILLQHFPLYRISDEPCTEPDSAPLWEKKIKFRLKIDALSKEATDYLVSKLKPRVAIGGHTHHGCKLYHEYNDTKFWEISVPSFSSRNRLDPKYLLVTISPDSYSINKCDLPRERSMVITAVLLLFLLIYYITRRK